MVPRQPCMHRRDNPLLRIDKQHRQTISRLNRDEKFRFCTHPAITFRGIGEQGSGGFENAVRMNLRRIATGNSRPKRSAPSVAGFSEPSRAAGTRSDCSSSPLRPDLSGG
jgi:hypothetical protein